jgi:uroporphyrinogen-III decarboxylase
MTARERLFACLEGKQTDRVPIWLLFSYHPTCYYVDVRTHPDYKPIFEASKKYAIMLNRRNFGTPSDVPKLWERA